MPTFQFTQHLTVRNIFIAIVALNMLSALSAGPFGGTFHDTVKPMARSVSHTGKRTQADLAIFSHMVPGEAVLPSTEMPAAPMRVVSPKQSAPVVPSRQKISSNPPSVSWIMLLTVGAMALYVRYMMGRAVQTAVGQLLTVAKRLVSAVAGGKTGVSIPGAGPSLSGPSIRQSSNKNPLQKKTAPSRQNTIVRPSRWPFAA